MGLVALEVQEDLEVQTVPRLQLQGQVCRLKSRPRENQVLQGDPAALRDLVDLVAQGVQVCDV